jgi:hypothetical protein
MAGSEKYIKGKHTYTDRPQVMSGASWVEPQGAVVLFDDFLGDTLNTDLWLLTQSGTPTTAGAISASAGDPVAGHGGWLAGATDDVDAEADELASSPSATAGGNFRADRAGNGMMVVEWAISIPTALTTRQYFAGFSDDATEGSGAIAINITGTTVADAATDAAGIGFYSAATDATHFLGASTDSNTQSTITACSTLAFDTWYKLRTEIDTNGDCYFYVGDRASQPATYYGTSNTGTSPDVLLMPYFAASPTTTTAVPWEIDYCFAACAR